MSNGTGGLSELAPIADLIGSTRIDGIPAVYAPRDGLIAAGLMFRVGMADEPLSLSGITHLVEHLALFDYSNGDVHHNGETSDAFTHFYVVGTEAEVVTYLNRVCRSLRELPLDRLETEKQILRTEASQKPASAMRTQRYERFGARGFGIAGLGELGLDGLTTTHVLDWSRTRFTRHNAIVWMTTAEPLTGLDLRLPDGSWIPLAPPQDIIETKPAYFGGPEGGVLLDALVPRSTAATVFSLLASRVLYRALRQEGGYSYTATCSYEPVDARTARVSLFADALPQQQAAVVGGLVDVLASLRAGTVDPEDLAYAIGTFDHMIDVPHLGSTLLVSTASRLLLGAPIEHPAAIVAEAKAVTVADIAGVAAMVWQNAVAQIPEGNLAWAGFAFAPRSSRDVVVGDLFPYTEYPDSAIIIASDGVSFTGQGAQSTVYFRDCVSMLATPDGARTFVGSDAFRVKIEPTLIDGMTPEITTWLDAQVTPEVIVRLRPRLAADIPQPDPAAVAAVRARSAAARKGLGRWAWFALLPAAVTSFLMLMLVSGHTDAFGEPTALGRSLTVPQLLSEWTATIAVTVFSFYLVIGISTRAKWKAARPTA